MACNRNGMACRDCLLRQEMSTIPARFLPQSVRTALSEILDPVRDLPNNDYRFFAEKNGMTPQKVLWLDSQKTQFARSSIGLVLDYLIDRDGDGFTVYHVYRTLCDMHSDGQRVILEAMPAIRRMYNQGSREGQEQSEPPSLNPGEHLLSRGRNPSPPPPYDSGASQQSNYLAAGDGAVPYNNLNAGCSLSHSSPSSCGRMGGGIPQQHDSNSLRSSHRPPACENSFHSAIHADRNDFGHQNGVAFAREMSFAYSDQTVSHEHLQPGRPEAGENSFSFGVHGDGSRSSALLPTYEDSQRHHGRTDNLAEIDELKLPLEGQVVEPGRPVTENNIQPDTSLATVSGMGGPSSHPPLPQLSQFNRPLSFPSHQQPSYQTHHSSSRPVSDANYCSHAGPCNCFTHWRSAVSPSHCNSGPPASASYSSHRHVFDGSASENFSLVSSEGVPWDDSRHQTEVKQLINGASRHQTELKQPVNRASHHQTELKQPVNGASRHQTGVKQLIDGASHHQTELKQPVNGASRHQTELKQPVNRASHHQTELKQPVNGASRHQTGVKQLIDGASHHQTELKQPVNGASRHQTELKQPINGASQQPFKEKRERSEVQYHSLPTERPNSSGPTVSRQFSVPSSTANNTTVHSTNGLSTNFVFILAADKEKPQELKQHVGALCQQLRDCGINYVVVISTSKIPVVYLPQHILETLTPFLFNNFISIQKFIWDCFIKASKVLVVITPGYMRYADKFIAHGEEATSSQQKLIHKIHEKLKREYFDEKRTMFRILPVLMLEMKANRVHVPTFLSNTFLSYFPDGPVMKLLRSDLSTNAS